MTHSADEQLIDAHLLAVVLFFFQLTGAVFRGSSRPVKRPPFASVGATVAFSTLKSEEKIFVIRCD